VDQGTGKGVDGRDPVARSGTLGVSACRSISRLGWRLDDDVAPLDGLRIVQFTPPRSGCSISFGQGIIAAAPGSAEATLTVSDIVTAHDELVSRGIDTTEVWLGPPFPTQVTTRLPGRV
jgi:hypothetical protein